MIIFFHELSILLKNNMVVTAFVFLIASYIVENCFTADVLSKRQKFKKKLVFNFFVTSSFPSQDKINKIKKTSLNLIIFLDKSFLETTQKIKEPKQFMETECLNENTCWTDFAAFFNQN